MASMTLAEQIKSLDDYFRDWEFYVFGYGYGTGEEYIIPVLYAFMKGCPFEGTYDYRELEEKLGGQVTWLLINTLCHADIIDYGSSTRFGWFTDKGKRLKEYISAKSIEELFEAIEFNKDYGRCSPTACCCGPDGYKEGRVCKNPFFFE